MSVTRAAETFRVSKSNLHDRISRKVAIGTLSGQSKYLAEKKDELLNFLGGCCINWLDTHHQWQQ